MPKLLLILLGLLCFTGQALADEYDPNDYLTVDAGPDADGALLSPPLLQPKVKLIAATGYAYRWYVVSSPSGGKIALSGPTMPDGSAPFAARATEPGTYRLALVAFYYYDAYVIDHVDVTWQGAGDPGAGESALGVLPDLRPDPTTDLRLAIEEFYGRFPHTSRPPALTSVAVQPGGNLVAVGCDDGGLRLWDKTTRDYLARKLPDNQRWLQHVSFSADGRTVVAAGYSGVVYVIDVATWEVRKEIAVGAPMTDLAVSADMRIAAAASDEGAVIWVNLVSGEVERLAMPSGRARAVAISPRGDVAVGAAPGKIYVFGADRGLEKTLESPVLVMESLRYSPSGQTLAVSGRNRWMAYWRLAGNQASDTAVKVELQSPSRGLLFMGEDRLVVTRTAAGVGPAVLDLAGGSIESELPDMDGTPTGLAYDADAGKLYVSGFNYAVRVLDF